MAVIGDILVKFVADFAEFAEGMQQSQSRLEDFGKQIEKSSGSIEKMFSQLRTLAILSAAALAVKQVVDWTMATAAAAAEQEKLARQLGYTTDEVQALQKIAKDTGNTFDATQRYYRTHRSELEALTKQFRDTGELMSGDSVKAFADISREMDKFAETLGRVRQQMQGGLVNTALSVISKMIKDAGESLAFFDVYKGTITSVRELMAIFTGAGGLVGFTAQERALQHVTELAATAAQKEIEYQKAQLDSAQKIEDATRRRADAIGKQRDAILQGGGAGGTATVNSQVQAAQAAAEQARAARDKAVAERDEAQKRYDDGRKIIEEANKPKAAPTIPTPGTGTGGGGRTDNESIEAQIERFRALEQAAKRTGATIEAYHATNIEDFQREVRVQQQVEDTAAKLGARYSEADKTRKEALRDQIRLTEEARDANSRLLEGVQRAVEIERRYGDGTAQAARRRRELSDAERANIATKTALSRATKQQQEADEQARLEAKRYDDDLGSLVAGFEHAANAYARANDLFSQGGQIFNATTTAMGEGLDALLGKSNKTFGQIAADFAMMLAKMALQAATSSVFQWAFNAMGFGGMASAGQPGSPYFGPVNPATLFGGARAAGGDVYPGMSYDVGEHGPERFVPTQAGRIEPMTSRDSGGVTVNVDMGTTQGTSDPGQALEFGRRVRAAVVDVIQQEKRPGGTLYSRANA